MEEKRSNLINDPSLTTLCHDLRGPLNNILGWIHLARTSADGVTWEEAAMRIEEQVQIQNRLIREILNLSKSTSGSKVKKKANALVPIHLR
jgi:signal transduction histidine kinase